MKYSNSELYDWIDEEGGDYYFTRYGPVSPDDVADDNLRPLWAECIAAAIDFREACDRVDTYLYEHLDE